MVNLQKEDSNKTELSNLPYKAQNKSYKDPQHT